MPKRPMPVGLTDTHGSPVDLQFIILVSIIINKFTIICIKFIAKNMMRKRFIVHKKITSGNKNINNKFII